MSRFAVLDFKYRELADFASRLNSALLHIHKEIKGYERSKGIGDEEIALCRDFFADVLETTRAMIEAREPDIFYQEVKKEILPLSIYVRLSKVWDEELLERAGRMDPMVARLRDQDVGLHVEDLEIVKDISRVTHDMAAEVHQKMHGLR